MIQAHIQRRAPLLPDRQQIQELWEPSYAGWFSPGLDDRDLALLRVHIEAAAYGDARDSVMVPERQRATGGRT